MAAGTEANKFMFAQVLKPNMQLNGPKGRSAGPVRVWPGRCSGSLFSAWAVAFPLILYSFQPKLRQVAKQYISEQRTEANKYRIESVKTYGGEQNQNQHVKSCKNMR